MADPGDRPEEQPEGRSEDEAWRAIVENYGDHPPFAEPPPPPPPAAPSASLEKLFQPWRATEWDGEGAAAGSTAEPDDEHDDEGFVPPEEPPQPLPPPDRLAAWIGVFGAPIVLLVCLFARIRPPELITYGLILWFVGGFGYLVAQMPREPRDPWDDGAQV